MCVAFGMCVSWGRKTLDVVRSIGSVVPLLWSRCQLCWEELSDGVVTSHSDAQWRAEGGGRVADTLPVNTTRSLVFVSLCFFLPPSTLGFLLFLLLLLHRDRHRRVPRAPAHPHLPGGLWVWLCGAVSIWSALLGETVAGSLWLPAGHWVPGGLSWQRGSAQRC